VRVLGIALSLLAGLHYYIWIRLIRDTAMPEPWRLGMTLLLIGLYVSIPASFFLYLSRQRLGKFVIWPGYIWMGMLLILPLWLLCMDVVRVAMHFAGQFADPAQHTHLFRVLGGAAAVLAGLTGGIALWGGMGAPRIREVDVTLRRLPRGLDGTTMVQLSDVHIGPTIGRGFMEGLVERSNALNPDLVVITGDLVDGSVRELGPAVAPLAGLRTKWGVYFVTGNHEYYSGANEWIQYLGTLGITVLRNERVTIGEHGQTFDLAGIDDPMGQTYAGHGPDLPRALAGRDTTRELILLAHQPRAIEEAAQFGVGLQLSGHTHGGQIWPFSWVVRMAQPHVAGFTKLADTVLYVSRGSGYWGPPMRLAAPAEITHITLRSSQELAAAA
jgi:predicted MPP superfamily phosphohydrolase